METKDTPPTTCAKCKVIFSAGSVGTSGSVRIGVLGLSGEVEATTVLAHYTVEPCPFHALAGSLLKTLEKVYEVLAPNEIAVRNIDRGVLAKATMNRTLPYSLALEVRETIEAAKDSRPHAT